MDILKLLSRSTKQPNKAFAAKGKQVSSLPSSGVSANPQLYHDAVPSKGKKRKRGIDTNADQVQEEVDLDVNFFAETAAVPKSKQKTTPKESETSRPITANLLDEDECRQILRSHRLKVTLFPSHNTQEKKVKKSKKQKVDRKSSKAKEEFQQVYPQPLEAFSELRTTYGIYGRLGENLADQGYKIPTEVQMGSLPLLLQPETALKDTVELEVDSIDLLAIAPTGSGKTLAFLIPIVNSILQRRRTRDDKDIHDVEAIVVAPTKELANQIVNEGKKLSLGTGVKVVGMKKGMKVVGKPGDIEIDSSVDESEDEEPVGRTKPSTPITKVDILVTTPGLLLSSLNADGKALLPNVRTLVLDEADVLLDPLFRDQTQGIWEACTNPDLRVTLWSATMGSNIESLVSSTIQSRREKLALTDKSRIVRLVVGLKDSAIPNITHRLTYAATESGKLIALRQLLHPTARPVDATEALRPPFLVFTQTIPRAIALHSELLYDIPAEAGGSSRIAVLHSDLSDIVRDQVMTRFRNGEIWVLITTDILSRGVDFRGINGVVNYDVPNSGASYIHRVGRTGRAGRDGGVAVTLYTKEDIPYVKNIANIIAASEKQAGKAPSEASMKKWLLDALPKPSKDEKKKLKMYGVEARRGGVGKDVDGKAKSKVRTQISTKSGYERKLENNRKGAIQGSKRRAREEVDQTSLGKRDDEKHDEPSIEWGGFDD